MITHKDINSILLRSIPMKKDTKSYFLKKLLHLSRHHGNDYAIEKFKGIMNWLKSELSSKTSSPLPGVRLDRHLKYLLRVGMAQPEVALNFINCLIPVGVLSKDQALLEFKERISCTRPVNEDYNKDLLDFIERVAIGKTRRDRKVRSKLFPRYWFTGYSSHEEVNRFNPISPVQYKDFDNATATSMSFENDINDICNQSYNQYFRIPEDILQKTLSAIPFVKKGADWLANFDYDRYARRFASVGSIHLVPKGPTYRPIAAPNRFLQRVTIPFYLLTKRVVSQLETDLTHHQTRDNSLVLERQTNGFVGSVDLKSATDNLPFFWAERLYEKWLPFMDNMTSESYSMFVGLSKSFWDLGSTHDQVVWRRGQPLGLLPSFNTLAITHHLICYYIADKLRFNHLPVRILGDDIVFFNEAFYNYYRKFLENSKIPHSETKSFPGRLTELAGQVFVNGTKVFRLPKPYPVHLDNLYDWQASNGIHIPWEFLPRGMRNRIESLSKGTTFKAKTLYRQGYYVSRAMRGNTIPANGIGSAARVFLKQMLKDEFKPRLEPSRLYSSPRSNMFGLEVNSDLPYSSPSVRRDPWWKSTMRPFGTDQIFKSIVDLEILDCASTGGS